MADPLSITASVVAVVTAAIQSTKSLTETVKRFKDRDQILSRLQHELEDLINILNALKEVTNIETSILALLKGPVDRCSQVCREFETSMKEFSGKSKTGFRDWAKMEFMRGDINEFMGTLAGYKSTISVGLGTITMHTSKISHQVLEEYHEMIMNTAYNLEIHLQRIDEKLALFPTENPGTSDTGVDLRDERAVTKQCLRICEDAKSYIESLIHREPSLQSETPLTFTTDDNRNQFEAQLLTRQALDENRQSFAEIIGRLRERLESQVLDGSPRSNNERLRLQEDITISRQCLEVCKMASNEVSYQKIYRIGEVIADGDSDQVVVTTLADLFDIKKALSKGKSAQLIGSMTDETLRQISENRYSSHFGGLARSGAPTTVTFEPQRVNSGLPQEAGKNEKPPNLEERRSRPHPNEMRKRAAKGDNETRDVDK
ncbi:Fc.00g106040.m01.CDS01 [Cosmosporella sp. VM-42]